MMLIKTAPVGRRFNSVGHMKLSFILLVLISGLAVSQEQEPSKLVASQSASPNGKYRVEGGVKPWGDETCCLTSVVDTKSGDVLFTGRFAGYIKDSSYSEAAWSEDSKHLAITGYETKRHK